MFSGCTNRINAPELPATTLAVGCYYSMFEGCANLIQAPELPATTLADYCYGRMFIGCTLLSYIKCLATDISAEYCIQTWTANVSDQGEFHCKQNVAWPEGSSGIPTGWTRHDI